MVVPCAVPGCEDKTSPRHRFPNPDKDRERFNKWITAVCNIQLQNMEPTRVYANYRICGRHFLNTDIIRNNLLIRTTIPSLELLNFEGNHDQNNLVEDAVITESSVLPRTLDDGSSQGSLIQEETSSVLSKTLHEDDHDYIGITTPSTSKEVSFMSPRSTKSGQGSLIQEETSSVLSKTLYQDDHDYIGFSTPSTSKEASFMSPRSMKTPPPSLLRSVDVTRSSELTPKAKTLYYKARNLQKKVSLYRKRTISAGKRIKLSKKFLSSVNYDIPNAALRSETIKFCLQQLARKSTAPRGRRFTLEEKLMSVALFKTSGSGYRFLANWFHLPSKRTLSRLLQKIPVDEGISKYLMKNLKESIKHFNKKEKLCTVMFDEIALHPFVEYNKHTDELIGTENGIIMDHALVFLVRGITRKWKQTVAYYFCKGTTSSQKIKNLLCSVIRELKKIGLSVIVTICDQGATNRAAIETMVSEARKYYLQKGSTPKRRLIIDNDEIIPMYDVPHLLKGIRNNLLVKDLVWETEKGSLTAKWDDIEKAYHIDNASGEMRCLTKITDYHVSRNKIKKMKVSHATQVFSHTLASVINLMAKKGESDITNRYRMEERAQDTARILKFFDSLFDSLNGGTLKGNPGKPLKGAVQYNSGHLLLWRNSIHSLKNMYFRKENTSERIIPPSLKNFIQTLESFIDLAHVLFSKNVNFFMPRSFNQDPLENYFCQVRQHRGRHYNPSCKQFKESYKALLIRNVAGPHSVASNCEETFETSLVQLKDLIGCSSTSENENIEILENPLIHKYISSCSNIMERSLSKAAVGYVSGFIAKKLFKKFNCQFCKLHILQEGGRDNHDTEYLDLCREKEFQSHKNALIYCNTLFIKCVNKIYNIAKYILSKCNIKTNVKKTIYYYVRIHVHFSFICDHKEELIKYLSDYVIDLCIFNFCRGINNIILGKETRISEKSCALYKQALDIHSKRRRYNK